MMRGSVRQAGEILELVSMVSGVPMSDLLDGSSRVREVTEARRVVSKMVRSHTTLSLQEIADLMHTRWHSVVVERVRQVDLALNASTRDARQGSIVDLLERCEAAWAQRTGAPVALLNGRPTDVRFTTEDTESTEMRNGQMGKVQTSDHSSRSVVSVSSVVNVSSPDGGGA